MEGKDAEIESFFVLPARLWRELRLILIRFSSDNVQDEVQHKVWLGHPASLPCCNHSSFPRDSALSVVAFSFV